MAYDNEVVICFFWITFQCIKMQHIQPNKSYNFVFIMLKILQSKTHSKTSTHKLYKTCFFLICVQKLQHLNLSIYKISLLLCHLQYYIKSIIKEMNFFNYSLIMHKWVKLVILKIVLIGYCYLHLHGKKKKTVQCFQKKKKNEESFEIQILDYIDFTLSEEC